MGYSYNLYSSLMYLNLFKFPDSLNTSTLILYPIHTLNTIQYINHAAFNSCLKSLLIILCSFLNKHLRVDFIQDAGTKLHHQAATKIN